MKKADLGYKFVVIASLLWAIRLPFDHESCSLERACFMLSVEECKENLKKFNLTDKQVEQFRNAAYSIVNDILDELYEKETDN